MNKTDLRSLSLFFYDLIILVGLHSLVAFKTVTMIRLQIRPRRHRWAGPERRHLNTSSLRNQAHTDFVAMQRERQPTSSQYEIRRYDVTRTANKSPWHCFVINNHLSILHIYIWYSVARKV